MQGRTRSMKPERVIAAAFAAAIAVGTLLLLLPVSNAQGEWTDPIDALFTATSAVCVTGLTTVDTGTFWSPFGQVVIAMLIQVGGIGIMTLATLIAVTLFRRMGLGARSSVQRETKAISAADLRRIIWRIVVFSLIAEAVLSIILFGRFLLAYDYPWWQAVSHGAFHSISSFNNAGFALYPDNLMGFAQDPWILLPIAAAVIIGGLGFPVIFELGRRWRHPSTWSALTRITLVMTVSLLALGMIGFLASERGNPATWGALPGGQQALQAFFTGVMPRTAGFNIVDVGQMRSESLALTDVLMFIGGGSAGTAGGVKVTTIGIIVYIIIAELRSRPDVEVGNKRIPTEVQRQALVVIALSLALVALGTIVLLALTDWGFDQVLFESVSAFGTVGLSTGITSSLPDAAKLALVLLMFAGRIGPLTFAAALAARSTTRLSRRPEERISLG
jgi:trk system potassium uptake protein TrkH